MFESDFAKIGPEKKVLEIGPGTGQATESILNTGCDYNLKLISFGSEPGTYLLSIFRIISTKLTVKNANVSPQLSG